MKNGVIAILLFVIGFIGGYVTKGLLVDTEKTPIDVQTDSQASNEEQKAQVALPPVKEEVFSKNPYEAALQKDFQTFRQASEGYLNSVADKDLDPNAYNVFLSTEYKLFYNKDGVLLSNKEDQWGNHYQVFINPKKQKILVQSNGEGKGGYVLASYQQDGTIESCTRGFEEGTWSLIGVFLKTGDVCGGDLQ